MLEPEAQLEDLSLAQQAGWRDGADDDAPAQPAWARIQLVRGRSTTALWQRMESQTPLKLRVGASETADWQIQAKRVRDHHLELFWSGSQLWVEPLGPVGETRIDGRALQGPRQLEGRQRIELGEAMMISETSTQPGADGRLASSRCLRSEWAATAVHAKPEPSTTRLARDELERLLGASARQPPATSGTGTALDARTPKCLTATRPQVRIQPAEPTAIDAKPALVSRGHPSAESPTTADAGSPPKPGSERAQLERSRRIDIAWPAHRLGTRRLLVWGGLIACAATAWLASLGTGSGSKAPIPTTRETVPRASTLAAPPRVQADRAPPRVQADRAPEPVAGASWTQRDERRTSDAPVPDAAPPRTSAPTPPGVPVAAAQALFSGRRAEALRHYRQLARSAGGQPAYAAIVRILAREAPRPCDAKDDDDAGGPPCEP